jgi:cytochrome bd ubiquinol oxidase subunit I
MLPVVAFDRFLMAYSLAIHIVLAAIGIALPVIILSAEFIGIRNNDKYFKVLARRLSIVFAILFAVGTASGLLVALNIFLLWPKFMALISQVAILPFYSETFAFFVESIFLGIYFYSWNKFKNEYIHVLVGIPIAIGSALSGVFITMINAFMNTPNGFDIQTYLSTGVITGIKPFAVFNTPSTWIEVAHVISTIYFAGGFVFAAYAAWRLLGNRKNNPVRARYYKNLLKIALVIVTIATVASLYTGVRSIETLLQFQPEKFAAIEGNLYPQSFAPERIGGIMVNGSMKDYISIPDLQSILSTGTASGSVPGLSSYPSSTWPPLIIHDMFDFMVLSGAFIGTVIAIIMLVWIVKRKLPDGRKTLYAITIMGIWAIFILEAGWVMAELGRQPWIIYNVMLVTQAANNSQSIIPITILIFLFYLFVIPATILILRTVFKERKLEKELISRNGSTY